MKRLVAGSMLASIAAASFAAEPAQQIDLENQTGFYGYTRHSFFRRSDVDHKAKPNAFFFGYRIMVGNQDNVGTTDMNEFSIIRTETPLSGNVIKEVQQRYVDWNWGVGHDGVIGMNLRNTFFSLFVNGTYMRHTANHTFTDANSVLLSFENTVFDIDALPDTTAEAKINGITHLWKLGAFLAYTSYHHSHFFLMPYVGPFYIYHKVNLKAEATIDADTVLEPEYTRLCKGLGPMLGTTAKFYFSKNFYGYGDARLSLQFLKEEIDRIYLTNTGSDRERELISNKKTGLVFQEDVGIGYEIRRKHFEADLLLCYEVFTQFFCPVTYHSLAASIILGF